MKKHFNKELVTRMEMKTLRTLPNVGFMTMLM